jgi:hypothetical protein
VGLLDRIYRAPGERTRRASELARRRVDGDLRALERLRADGRDPALPLALQFGLRLPTRRVASELAAPLRADGYAIEIVPADDPEGRFDLLATRVALVSDEALLAESERLAQAALEAGGDYRGWRIRPAASG